MDYRKLLIYYLSSDEWKEEMDYFFEIWHHHWDPQQEYYTPNHTPSYVKSTIYLEFEKKLAAAGGSYLDLRLTDQQFRRFFDKRYSAGQRFNVLFGLWWGLSDAQINRIADLRMKHNCSCLLNYYLCNPNADPQLPIKTIRSFQYTGTLQQMKTGANTQLVTDRPLPPDEMRTFVLRIISYEQLKSDIVIGVVRGSVTQLDRIVDLVIRLQYETGTTIIDGIELPIDDVAHRLLQAKHYDIELILGDMTSHKKPRLETDHQLICALYNTIGSLRSYQRRQRRGSKMHQ